ncbi:hypothetical protein COOONC_00740 [Cooperia oncophora]
MGQGLAPDLAVAFLSKIEKPASSLPLSTDYWLAFLNVQLQLLRGWYRKPSNKNIIVHYSSAHPLNTKKVTVGDILDRFCNFIRRRIQKGSIVLAYRVSQQKGCDLNRGQLNGVLGLMSSAIRACLQKANIQDDVRVFEVPPQN